MGSQTELQDSLHELDRISLHEVITADSRSLPFKTVIKQNKPSQRETNLFRLLLGNEHVNRGVGQLCLHNQKDTHKCVDTGSCRSLMVSSFKVLELL